jgi:D-specific alpha-keto acid dehydrogenase
MTCTKPARPVEHGACPLASSSPVAIPAGRITAYGCGQDEAAAFREIAPRFGITPTITEEQVSGANIGLALGNRCISVGHKTPIANPTLLALRQAGVAYVSTRSIGYNHLDVNYAQSIGITLGNVSYSPDSVADYTLMLMLMSVRHATSVVRRTDAHDYRLNDVRGRELRDLTVGVIGTGRIGTAVMDRLRSFGCRTLVYDIRPKTAAHYVPLAELLEQSDIVTLHTPLTPDTHHLLDRRRIAQMKPEAIVINTGRGALLDTGALLSALERSRLGGAALDVIEGEDGIFYADRRDTPIENAALVRLQQLPNVLISPHTAYYTDHALRDTVESTIVNCLTFEKENAAWTD